jgi:hypothetical protein
MTASTARPHIAGGPEGAAPHPAADYGAAQSDDRTWPEAAVIDVAEPIGAARATGNAQWRRTASAGRDPSRSSWLADGGLTRASYNAA